MTNRVAADEGQGEGRRTGGPGETERLGAELARELRPGDVVLVSGELGAGKTTFIRGACRELGVRDPVTSPTFVIGHRYEGRLPVSHLDLYRLAGLEGEDPGLLDDYLTEDAVSFVEWPAIAEPTLGRVAAAVRIEHAGEDSREIAIERR
ncbi:MAG: tRNA threonylcarbamoyladenosine biosynthesis protein TsaE [Solirubrobacterales bacterium]|jgi:tRNA threonylcarbamoyladenosine biosynthesis protein TsaE|nr:tRNA threonylcarbamoyladenosine biosynthesis protein TsaE [Solirubrobacterales bacterium]